MKRIQIEVNIDVPFYDVDPMNVVWHGNYLKYAEIVRTALMDKLNYGYKEMKKDSIIYPIAKMETKFIKPAHFSDKLKLIACLEEYEPVLRIKYTFKNQSNNIIFKASSMQICVSTITNESLYVAPHKLKQGVLKCLENL